MGKIVPMKSRTIIAFLLLSLFLPHLVMADVSIEAEDNEAHKLAWTYDAEGRLEDALKLAEKYGKRTSPNWDGWMVLVGHVYLKQEKYQSALNAIETVRPRLKKVYDALQRNPDMPTISEDSKKTLKWLYFNSLNTSRIANFKLEKWADALRDFNSYAETYEPDASDHYFIGICYYFLQDYSKSLEHLEASFQLKKDDVAAYNISCIYARQGDIEKSMIWLKIALQGNKELWLGKVRTDKDFNAIRNRGIHLTQPK